MAAHIADSGELFSIHSLQALALKVALEAKGAPTFVGVGDTPKGMNRVKRTANAIHEAKVGPWGVWGWGWSHRYCRAWSPMYLQGYVQGRGFSTPL